MDIRYWDIAVKELEGKATAAEQEEFRNWLEKDPDHLKQFQEQQKLWRLSAPPASPEVDTDKAWHKVSARIQSDREKPKPKKISIYSTTLGMAASLTLLIGFLWLGKLLFFPYYGLEVVESGDATISVMLPDSSQVWLNRNSKLIYDPAFGGLTREVKLVGEAFFEVRKNPELPFLIQTGNSQTKVLGTSFNLRAYPDESAVELVVATGKVAFGSKDGSSQTIINPGYAAKLDRESTTLTTYSSEGENAWAWKSGRLQFEGEALTSVLQELERYYEVKFHLNNSAIGNCSYTGSFELGDLEKIMQVLSATLQLEYSKNEQGYRLSGQGCGKNG